LQVLFLAIGGIGDGTDGQDDFYQSALHPKTWPDNNTPNPSPRFRISTRTRVCLFNKMLARGERHRSVGKQLCRIAKPCRRSSRYDTSETTGLDIRRKRAMFRKYIKSCLGLQRAVSAPCCRRRVYPADPKDFQKP
jgi:hypothetical protein